MMLDLIFQLLLLLLPNPITASRPIDGVVTSTFDALSNDPFGNGVGSTEYQKQQFWCYPFDFLYGNNVATMTPKNWNMGVYAIVPDSELLSSTYIAAPAWGHGQRQTLYYDATSLMLGQLFSIKLNWGYQNIGLSSNDKYSFCYAYSTAGICQCHANWVAPTAIRQTCSKPTTGDRLCITKDSLGVCILCMPGYELGSDNICQSHDFCIDSQRYCKYSKVPIICNTGYWPSSDLSKCHSDLTDKDYKASYCLYHVVQFDGQTGGCFMCSEGYVVSYDGMSCEQPIYSLTSSYLECRIFEDATKESCRQCKPNSWAGYNDTAQANRNTLCTSLNNWVYYRIRLKLADPTATTDSGKGMFEMSIDASDHNCTTVGQEIYVGSSFIKECGFKSSEFLYYNYTINFTASYFEGISKCSLNLADLPNISFGWSDTDTSSVTNKTVPNWSNIWAMKIDAKFYANILNPYTSGYNATFFKQQFPILGLQEAFYIFDFYYTPSNTYWNDVIYPNWLANNYVYRIYQDNANWFCPRNCYMCNEAYYVENTGVFLGNKCIHCYDNFLLDYLGICRCMKYSYVNNYSAWQYGPVTFNTVSASNVDLKGYALNTDNCYKGDDLIINNCGYCLRAWMKHIGDDSIYLQVSSIIPHTYLGRDGFNITIIITGKHDDEHVYETCMDELKVYMGITLNENSQPFAPYFIWKEASPYPLRRGTNTFVTWVTGDTSTALPSINFPYSMLTMYYHIIVGVDIYKDNSIGCGNPVNTSASISQYQNCHSFADEICQCFPMVISYNKMFQSCSVLEVDNAMELCLEADFYFIECTQCVPGYKLVIDYQSFFPDRCMTSIDQYNVPGCYMAKCEGGCDKFCDKIITQDEECLDSCLVCDENYWPSSTVSGTCTQDTNDVSLYKTNCKNHRITGVCYICDLGYVLNSDGTDCIVPQTDEPSKLAACRQFNDTLANACYECQPGFYQMDRWKNSYCMNSRYPFNFELSSKFIYGFAVFDDENYNEPSSKIMFNITAMIEGTPTSWLCNGCQIEQVVTFDNNNATYLKICWDQGCTSQLNSYRVKSNDTVYVQFASLTKQNIWNTTTFTTPNCLHVQTIQYEIPFLSSQCSVVQSIYGTGINGWQATINFEKIYNEPNMPSAVHFKQDQPTDDTVLSKQNQNIRFTLVIQNDYEIWTWTQQWNFNGGFLCVMNILVPSVISTIMLGVCGITVTNILKKMGIVKSR